MTTIYALFLFLATPALADNATTAAIDVSLTGAPDSCVGFTGGLRAGYEFHTEVERHVGLFVRPEGKIRSLPCIGYSPSLGGRGGAQLGPVRLGLAVYVGAAYAAGRQPKPYLHVDPSAFLDVVVGPVELGLHGGPMFGHMGQGWLDIGTHVGVRF
jgi:hypothetical protein